jgi:hypothetical protein
MHGWLDLFVHHININFIKMQAAEEFSVALQLHQPLAAAGQNILTV